MKRTLFVLFVAAVVAGVPPVSSVTLGTSGTVAHAQENAAEYPPGLSPEGVTDPLALADAHRDALRNASYTATTVHAIRRPNGSLLSQGTTTSRVASGGASYYTVTTQSQANATRPLGIVRFELGVWANETSAVLARQVADRDPTYRQVTRERAPFDPDANWELLYSAFGATDTTVVEESERDGTTLFRVVSTGRKAESAYPNHVRYSFVAVVDSQGVVRSFQQTYRTTFDEGPAVVTRTVQVTAVGNTTVEKPEWYGKAVANESVGG